MNPAFSAPYARAYDLLYQEKDYAAECDIIVNLSQRFADGPVRRILDLGCGTGNHTIPLAARGYDVTGVERSADMLAEARRKVSLTADAARVTLQQGDIRDVRIEGPGFDIALMMFAVLGYQLSNADVRAALRTASKHLRAGGLLLFDVWYGPGVLSDPPRQRIRVVKGGHEEVIRVTDTDIDTRRHLCNVRFQLWRMPDGAPVDKTEEVHAMRYFFPLELEAFLAAEGFELVALRDFPDTDREPNAQSWNVIVVAKATGRPDGK